MQICVISVALIFSSCDEYLDIPAPSNQLIKSTVFEDDRSAIAGISAIYGRMVNLGSFASGGYASVSFFSALSSDDIVYTGSDIDVLQFYDNSLQATNPFVSQLWNDCYSTVFFCNSLIEGLEKSEKVSLELEEQLRGEALFIRAFTHFNLVNLYGRIPYIATTDYISNSHVAREPVSEVYRKIVSDLNQSITLLANDYAFIDGEKIRANKYVAISLLARVNLYLGEYSDAEKLATEVISRTDLYGLEDSLNYVFLRNSKEAILQLDPSQGRTYTAEGQTYLTSLFYLISPDLYNSFEVGDLRRAKWLLEVETVGGVQYTPYKYKDDVSSAELREYSVVFRLAEQYLIRAEARARQEELFGEGSAIADLDSIRLRAGLPPSAASSKDEIISAIMTERRVELFSEWAHRWFDLKRTASVDSVLSQKKASWVHEDMDYPIPNVEILKNRLIRQNDGY